MNKKIFKKKSDRKDSDKKRLDVFNTKLKKEAVEKFNQEISKYEVVAEMLGNECEKLFFCRENALQVIIKVQNYINQIANKPKEFEVNIKKIDVEIKNFEGKKAELKKAEIEAKIAGGGAGTGATLSALGLAVATMGPTAAMGIATTFGVASTGTAISALSGAAATNAALAWLGGGALAAGGGGMAAGGAFLALAGPVGWSIAGGMCLVSIGSGIFRNKKNKKAAEEAINNSMEVVKLRKQYELAYENVRDLRGITEKQVQGIKKLKMSLKGLDYSQFTDEEKLQLGAFVNNTFALAELINKEVDLNE